MSHTFSDYFDNLLMLLRQERKEDRRQYELKIRNRTVEERRKEGVCWYPCLPVRSSIGVGEKWVVELERTITLNQPRHHFQTGASVSIFFGKDANSPSTIGIISRISDHKITVVLHREDPPDWLDDGKLGIDLLFDESTYDDMERTLDLLKKQKEGRVRELIGIFHEEHLPHFNSKVNYKFPGLNEKQNEALSVVLAAQDIALIHGPPGTGKTTTLVETIVETVTLERQVLVCAASNSAVDLLVEKLHDRGINVTRLGHPARVNEEVISHALDTQIALHPEARRLKELRVKSESLRKMASQYKRKFGRAEAEQRKYLYDEAYALKQEALHLEDFLTRDILDRTSVIACTLTGAASSYLKGRSFKTVFIDEASQALEPACWIPIIKSCKVVMAGDHFQLPPTIKSTEAAKSGLSYTLFERAMNIQNASVMLDTQYRMHENIMAFSNVYFYRNKLKAAPAVQIRNQLFDYPALFIDTAGCGYSEELDEKTLSTYNKDEAYFLIKVLPEILVNTRKEPSLHTVGIIAPYRAQIGILQKTLNENPLPETWGVKTEIATVDSFQGQERDAIFISLTRSNTEGIIGFLDDDRRINVALTRAKHLLVVVGDSSTLSRHSFFDQLITHFQHKNSYRSAFEFLYH